MTSESNLMRQNNSNQGENRRAEGPDPVLQPEYYDGISVKRVLAYVLDFLICAGLGLAGWMLAAIVGIMSFGLLLAPMMAALALIPLAYHTYFIGTQGQTVGMKMCNIKVYRLDGQRPEMLQAFIQSAIFFLTVPVTSSLILLVCLFNTRRRCLHDILAGTLVLNDVENEKD